jgi:hypothetical protein
MTFWVTDGGAFARQPIKNTSSNLKNAESSSPKTSINIQDSKKDQSAKSSKDRPPIKSKVPVRKVASQKVPTSKEQTKNVEPKCDKVPKENKWQGAITLSASLEEGPTLKAPLEVLGELLSAFFKFDDVFLIGCLATSFDDTVAMELLDCTLPPFPG